MTDSLDNKEPSRLRVEVNSDVILAKFQVSLQNIIDVVNFSLAARLTANEQAYENGIGFYQLTTAKSQHLSYQAVQEEFSNQSLRNSLRDAIELMANFLEDIHDYCQISRFTSAGSIQALEWNKFVKNTRLTFHRKGLPNKLTYLKEEFGVTSEFSEHILSLNKIRNCLVHRQGVVSDLDVDETGILKAKWNSFDGNAISPDGKESHPIIPNSTIKAGWSIEIRLINKERSFPKGERIIFPADEHVHSLMTLLQFGISIINSMKAYYQKCKELQATLQPTPSNNNTRVMKVV